MIDELYKSITPLIQEELARSRAEYEEAFVNDADAYNVTREEVDEARREMEEVAFYITAIGKSPKRPHLIELLRIYRHATYLACEAIQVAAMTQKWMESPNALNKEESNE